MLRRLVIPVLLAALLALQPGCGVLSWLPAVISAVTEAGSVLNAIDSRARPVVDSSSDEKLQKRYAQVMAAAHATQAAALAVMKAGEAANRKDLDAAWKEFQKAYAAVLDLLGPLGVVAPSADGLLSASKEGPLIVPEPGTLKLPE